MSGVARRYFSHLTPKEREAIVDYVLARRQSAAVAHHTFTRLSGGRYSFCPGLTSNAGYQASMLRTVSAR